VLGLLLGSVGVSVGQELVVRGGFFLDSLSVGDETGFFLTGHISRNINLVFPDSTFDYHPFEFNRKRYFPTQTANGKSYDSVIYYLSTFEVDRVLPAKPSCISTQRTGLHSLHSNVDTVLLTELVKNIPDTLTAKNLPLKVNTIYEDVPYLFNYPVLFISIGVLLVVTFCRMDIFWKKNQKTFQVEKDVKRHINVF
jgi:hypothetical protein